MHQLSLECPRVTDERIEEAVTFPKPSFKQLRKKFNSLYIN